MHLCCWREGDPCPGCAASRANEAEWQRSGRQRAERRKAMWDAEAERVNAG